VVRVIVRKDLDKGVIHSPSGMRTHAFPPVANHVWASVNGQVAYVPIGVEVELGEAFISALLDSGVTVEEVA